MSEGKRLRLMRLGHPRSGRWLLLPLDHALALGPVPGLERPWTLFQAAARAGVQAIIGHRGLLRRPAEATDCRLGRLLHLTGATGLGEAPGEQAPVACVTEALALGCDGVSFHATFGAAGEARMLAGLGRTAALADRWGLPLLVMAYVAPGAAEGAARPRAIAHAARAAAELGADLVKVAWPGSQAAMSDVVGACPVPVVVAGGPAREGAELTTEGDTDTLALVRAALAAGAAGACVGRRVFQAPSPRAALAALASLVHGADAGAAAEPREDAAPDRQLGDLAGRHALVGV